MTWFKVDDTFAHHYKASGAGNAAIGLWVRAGAWSMQNLTDGHIPGHVLRGIGTKRQAERLVWAGLWDPDPLDGYRFHDWDDYQPSRDAVEYHRDTEAAKKRNQRRNGYRLRPPRDQAGRFTDVRGDAADDARSERGAFLGDQNFATDERIPEGEEGPE